MILALVPALASIRARWLGHALCGDPHQHTGPDAGYLVAAEGAFPHQHHCLRTRAIIGWVMHESFFQRRAGLVTLEATVATSTGHVRILDVPKSRAVQVIRAATPHLMDEFLDPAGRP